MQRQTPAANARSCSLKAAILLALLRPASLQRTQGNASAIFEPALSWGAGNLPSGRPLPRSWRGGGWSGAIAQHPGVGLLERGRAGDGSIAASVLFIQPAETSTIGTIHRSNAARYRMLPPAHRRRSCLPPPHAAHPLPLYALAGSGAPPDHHRPGGRAQRRRNCAAARGGPPGLLPAQRARVCSGGALGLQRYSPCQPADRYEPGIAYHD